MELTNPGPIERRLASLDAARRQLLVDRLRGRGGATGRRLVAAVVAGENFDTAPLREFLGARLPSYMIPQVFARIDEIPRTPAGKTDRRTLGERRWSAAAPTTSSAGQASTKTERALAGIWADVLGFDTIAVDDNFFEVGGDSLLAIRILSRSAKAGYTISPADFFANPTIAAQARLVESDVAADSGPIAGELPLLPIQHWFFDHVRSDRQQWNQSLLCDVAVAIDDAALASIVECLLVHHDALRTRFEIGDDQRRAHIAGSVPEIPLQHVDCRDADTAGLQDVIQQTARALNESFELGAPPLIRFARFRAAAGDCDKLLVVAHHLVVDATSWRILVDDLETLLVQAGQGKPPQLPVRTTSVAEWATRLMSLAESGKLDAERSFWIDNLAAGPMQLPSINAGGPNREAGRTHHGVVLDRAESGELIRRANREWKSGVPALLLSALARVIAEWTGNAIVHVDSEGHGREILFDDVDLSRTVGWFTSVYPLRLAAASAADWQDPLIALRLVKESLQALAHSGLGFGLLREFDRKNTAALRQDHNASILFNYLGNIDPADGILKPVDFRSGFERSGQCERAYQVEVETAMRGGQLETDFVWNSSLHDATTIERLADGYLDALRELLRQPLDSATKVTAATDFPLASLDEGEFDALQSQLQDIDGDQQAS